MTTDEAIEIKETRRKGGHLASLEELEEADRLGLEALKHFQGERAEGYIRDDYLLPGETED